MGRVPRRCVAVMDLGFYYWHILNHKIPLLWRFHNVHHYDPELDVSTGFRFHFGEVVLSVVFRVVQVTVIGVPGCSTEKDNRFWTRYGVRSESSASIGVGRTGTPFRRNRERKREHNSWWNDRSKANVRRWILGV